MGARGNDEFEAEALDPGFRRDDESRWSGGRLMASLVAGTQSQHHPHPTLPLKGRAKAADACAGVGREDYLPVVLLHFRHTGHPWPCRKLLLHFRHTGHPWPAGNCSCISGIPAIHGHKKGLAFREALMLISEKFRPTFT
jgi:hypothetical protein